MFNKIVVPPSISFFWCSASLQPFRICFVVPCLLPCNSASACKHSLQRSDADFPHCRRLVCVGRVSKQESSRNFSVPFFRLNNNMYDFQIMSDLSSIARQRKCPYCMFSPDTFQKILFHGQLF